MRSVLEGEGEGEGEVRKGGIERASDGCMHVRIREAKEEGAGRKQRQSAVACACVQTCEKAGLKEFSDHPLDNNHCVDTSL